MTLKNVYFYRSPADLPGAFDTLFGGLYLVKGIPLIGQLFFLLALAVAGMAARRSATHPKPWRTISIAASCAVFSLLALFLLQPWDEVFINLRHSLNWSESGRFSFNPEIWEEGTVETLPYFIIGCLARLGLPLLETGFLMSFSGGALCLLIAYRFLRAWAPERFLPWAFLVTCLFPPLAYNASHGFGTLWFSAALLGAVYSYWVVKRPSIGTACLALLPLIRFEGIFAAGVFFAVWVGMMRPRLSKAVGLACLIGAPAALHAWMRWQVYGEVIPLPVQYKASFGSFFFFAVGMRNLAADAIATHALCFGLLIALFRKFLDRTQALILLAFVVCTLPYYLSGGDWFPSYWGRYLFPLTFYLLILALSVTIRAFQNENRRAFFSAMAFPLVFFFVSSLWPISSTWKALSHLFSHRRTLAMIHEPTIARGHYRIQNLSRLGEHLRRTTLPSDRIGTSELATIAYFAKRPCIDYLGLINPEIAHSPLREMPSLLRRFPYRSELPYLIFRRLRPDLLAKTQPEILYTFDFLIRDQIPNIRPYELDEKTLTQALGRWEKQLGGLVDPLYGGLEEIQRLGYAPIVVQAGDDFSALYFVHTKALGRHLDALKNQGFVGGMLQK